MKMSQVAPSDENVNQFFVPYPYVETENHHHWPDFPGADLYDMG